MMEEEDEQQNAAQGPLHGVPDLYSILRGEVVSVTTYGAFVKVEGYKKQGLVHVSEMSACRVENPAEVVDVGEQVWIKVIGREITGEKIKLSFSMKAVNQGSGKDQDPNNVMAEQDERRRRRFKDLTGQRITLEAVLNTTCKKCGCKGHFAADCFSQGGQQYNLLPDEETVEPVAQTSQPMPSSDKQEEKRGKKRKKEKKEKKRNDHSSDEKSSSKKARHSHSKKKKHKKHKKQK
ncbi:zinc finger CCHC domain-containing protein 17 [Alosa pseudoharengus]|uniref:nucleolar protein of 40 kDa n=1 Tax=Alosa sapidissima TaxID=34773 RepID=UPI001C0848DF|nr:nucleolar protein of 40 kDa [Alosa sapidissima]